MKLEVGMYVRTDNGIIGKIYEKIGDMFTYKDSNRDYITYDLLHSEITKASYNIVDLIEENDYINGLRVEKNKYGKLYTSYVYYGGDIGKQCEVYTTWLKDYKIEYIETIATHQQFEQRAYKVGE